MPSTGSRAEDQLIEHFLEVFEGGSWAKPLSERYQEDRHVDGGVEMIATRKSDGKKLAIEHTLIEPFVGEKVNFHGGFSALAEAIRSDDGLKKTGSALYVEAPTNAMPKGARWPAIIADVLAWLRLNRESFRSDPELRACPSAHHPEGNITFRMRLENFEGEDAFAIVQRYGDMKIEDSVRKALKMKLEKLTRSDADQRILMLERDQPWVIPDAVCEEVERLRPDFPRLDRVDIWLADTATFGPEKDYLEFQRREGKAMVESFTFFKNVLIGKSRNGIPLPMGRRVAP